MEITTRRAQPGDAEILAEVANRTFYDTFTGTCTEADMEEFLGAYFNLEQVKKELSNEHDMFYVAESGGKVVGYLRIMEDYQSFPLVKQWKALELKRIYVEKEFHGSGVAQVLMELVLNYAAEHSYEVVWLGVWEHNKKAQRFYEKYGFVNSGHTHDFPIGNTPQTDCWFWKFL